VTQLESILMTQTPIQLALQRLEEDFAQYSPEERDEIEIIRDTLRELILKYDSSAKLAILAASLEVRISLG
jgi:hypothetical protein